MAYPFCIGYGVLKVTRGYPNNIRGNGHRQGAPEYIRGNKQREGEYSIYSLHSLYGDPRTRERRGKERTKEVRGSEVMRLSSNNVNPHNR